MALKSTIFKIDCQVSDINRHYYANHQLTLARHPSETDERMMVRLLAFALHAGDQTEFCKGLSNEDEPALWVKTLSNEIETWVEVGTLDEKRIKKACSQSKHVVVYCYGGNSADIWWQQNQKVLATLKKLKVFGLDSEQTKALASCCERNMDIQITIEDESAWLTVDDKELSINIEPWL